MTGAQTAHAAHHKESTRKYWIVAAALAILTAAEVSLFLLNEQEIIPKLIEVFILLALSTAKGSLVVMFFMHLKGDAGIFKFVFLAPFFMVISFALIFLLIFQSHVGIAG